MSKTTPAPERGQASTQTIAVAATAMQTIVDCSEGMPSIAVLSGPPGLGKTSAATYLCHPSVYNAVYVRCHSFETTKSLALMLVKELGIHGKARWSTSDAFDHIAEALVQSDRPLVVDEVDHISKKTAIDFLRDLHDTALTKLFLIGEAGLKKTLRENNERFHDRVLVWEAAKPANLADLDKLTRHYAPGIKLEADAKAHLLAATQGVARLICTSINTLRSRSLAIGSDTLSLADVQAALKGVR